METRRDQLHAYRFASRRAISALMTGEPDTVEPPMRRLTTTTISGIMIAIVLAAAFAVYGLIKPGSGKDWDKDGSIVVERETGARFVVIGGKLYPALNYASAVLASGATGTASVTLVSRSALAKVDRGETIGIPGLPDSMPPASALVPGPVTACSQATADGVNVTARVSVGVATTPPGTVIPDGEAAYVSSFAGTRYLLLDGQRHRLASPEVISALGVGGSPVPVGSALLTAVPEGSPLQTPTVPGQGTPGAAAGGKPTLVGQLLQLDDGSWRVVLADGVAVVTPLEAALLRTAKLGGAPRDPLPVSVSSALGLAQSASAPEVLKQFDGLPETMPKIASDVRTAGGVCAIFTGSNPLPRLAIPDGTAPASDATSESARAKAGLADVVSVRPGAAVLAKSARAAAVNLIAEPGARYSAASQATLGGFGYGSVAPVQLPDELLVMIPPGPALDPAAARRPVAH